MQRRTPRPGQPSSDAEAGVPEPARRRRTSRSGTALLATAGLLAACSTSPGAEARLLDALPDGDVHQATVLLAAAFDDKEWDRFATVCPYSRPDGVARDLGIPARRIPDLSTTDDSQAVLLIADGEVVSSWTFGRGAVDLCPGAATTTAAPGDSLTLARDHEGRWNLRSA